MFTGHTVTQAGDDIRTVRLSINHQRILWNLNRCGNNLSIKQMLYSTAVQRSKSWPAFHYKLGGRIYSAGFKMYKFVLSYSGKKRLTRLQLWPTILNSEYLLLSARRDVKNEDRPHKDKYLNAFCLFLQWPHIVQLHPAQTPTGSANDFISLSSLGEI